MQLTILGSYGPYPNPGGAVNGFLVSSEDTNIVLDLGCGSLSNYALMRKWHQLDAVILSHLHSDHTGDINVLQYVMQYEKECRARLYLPSEPLDECVRICSIPSIDTKLYNESIVLCVGPMEIDFLPVVHPVKTYAIRIRCKNKTFVYTADSSYTEDLIPFANNADLLLCEAGVLDHQVERKHIHMSITEGCRISRAANVKKTVFCHLLASNPLSAYREELNENRDVCADIASENKIYYI